MDPARSSQRRRIAAVLLLVASTAALAWFPRFAGEVAEDGAVTLDARFALPAFLALAAVAAASFAALAIAAWRAPVDPGPRARALLLGVALLLRAIALPAPPWLSDDVWRYLWEGAVQRAGHSPYLHAPDDPALDGLDAAAEAIRRNVAHARIPAAYPPAAQLLFRCMPADVLAWKLLVTAGDVALLLLIARGLRRGGRPPARVLLYAWHPLIVLELAGSGHVDGLALLAMGLSLALLRGRGAPPDRRAPLRREIAAGALAGLAGMIKPQGFLPLAAFAARRRWRALAAALAAALLLWLPFAGGGVRLFDGLLLYARHWEFNGLIYPPMVRLAEHLKAALEALPDQPLHLWRVREIGYEIVPNQLGRTLSLLVLVAAAAWIVRRVRPHPVRVGVALLAAFLATAPAVHPWYVAWLAPFLPFLRPAHARALLLLTLTTLLAYAVRVVALTGAPWSEPPWVALGTWLPPCLLGARDAWRERGR